MNLVSLESLLIHLLDNTQISMFSKVDIMYLLLYWVTYAINMRTLSPEEPFLASDIFGGVVFTFLLVLLLFLFGSLDRPPLSCLSFFTSGGAAVVVDTTRVSPMSGRGGALSWAVRSDDLRLYPVRIDVVGLGLLDDL